MKAIITGMNGTVAPALAALIKDKGLEVISWDRTKIPTDNINSVTHYINSQKPSHFFHIATGSPLWAENIAKICFENNIVFIFTGSVSVFSTQNKGPFTIKKTADANDAYGLYKIECERRIKFVNPNAIIARLGWQIGTNAGSNNMVDFLYKTMKEKGLIEASRNWFPSCSFLTDTVQSLFELALDSRSGIFHLEGNPGLSFFEIATALNKIHGLPWKIVKTQTPRLNNLMTDKRISVRLISKRLQLLPQ